MILSRSTRWIRPCCFSLAVSAGLVVAQPAPAAEGANADSDWAQWRGPSAQGYSDDQRVPLSWSDSENLLWKAPLPGVGNSTPIIWGERIFLTASSHDGKDRRVLCVNASDGKILWQKLAARDEQPGGTHSWNGYASPSCTTDGHHVFAFFGTPGLFCYTVDGELVWQHNFGVFTSEAKWGVGASPFLFEDLVIQNCDNDGRPPWPAEDRSQSFAPMSLVALDKATGKPRWEARRNQGRGFSTPVLQRTAQSRLDLLLNGPHGIWAYDPHTGKERWHCERHKGQETALFGEPLPVRSGETLFVASGRMGPLLALRMGDQGDVTASNVVWENVRKGSRDVASPILWEDGLYMADIAGALSEYDIKTGKLRFKQKLGTSPFSSSPVALRGHLLWLREDGTTFVVEPGKELKVVAKNHLSDPSEFRASPAVHAGRLFLRSQSYLYCLGEKK